LIAEDRDRASTRPCGATSLNPLSLKTQRKASAK
jgi:hypothetical protein